MLKIAAVVWIMIRTVIAGSAVITVLSVPELASNAMKNIPLAGIAGFLIAIPVAIFVARRMSGTAVS